MCTTCCAIHEIVWKMDLRNMLNFLRQRLHHHAQKRFETLQRWSLRSSRSGVLCPYAAFEEHTLGSMTLSRSEIKLVHYLNTMDANGLHTHLQYPEALSTINTLKEMGVIGEEYNLYSKRTKTQDLLAKLDTLGLCGMLSWFLHQFKDLHESITKGEQEWDPSSLSSVYSSQQALVLVKRYTHTLEDRCLPFPYLSPLHLEKWNA